MPVRLLSTDPGFEESFARLLAARRDEASGVDRDVARILDDVRQRGDAAVIDYTQRFDRLTLTPETLRIPDEDILAADAACSPRALAALDLAEARIAAYHARQVPPDGSHVDEAGLSLGWRWRPVSAAGVYVPGGRAAYPSSVLMNAVPARIAGVARIVMTVPTPDGLVNPLVLAAARRAGVHEIYRIGGAQAIAALAYGTEGLAPVDVIVGPGNAWVAAAKRQLYGTVGIDMVAGPSEILVVADGANDPDWIAIDLLSQAEHDPSAQAILITDDRSFADRVEKAVASRLKTLPREAVAGESWARHGAVIVVDSLDAAPALIDRIAPEHLELAVEAPDALAARVCHAGAIFLGRFTPEAIGDYMAGPNHVLPTNGTARFASGLSVLNFLKRTSLIGCDSAALRAIGPAAMALAEAEGLDAHALSLGLRLNMPLAGRGEEG